MSEEKKISEQNASEQIDLAKSLVGHTIVSVELNATDPWPDIASLAWTPDLVRLTLDDGRVVEIKHFEPDPEQAGIRLTTLLRE